MHISTYPERRQKRRIITLASASHRSRAASSTVAFSSARIFCRSKIADSSSSKDSPDAEFVDPWLTSAFCWKRPRDRCSFWGEYISSYVASCCDGPWWRASGMGLSKRFPRQEVAAAVVHGWSSGAGEPLAASVAPRCCEGDFDRRALFLIVSSCPALSGAGDFCRSNAYGDVGNKPRAYNGSVAGARCSAPWTSPATAVFCLLEPGKNIRLSQLSPKSTPSSSLS